MSRPHNFIYTGPLRDRRTLPALTDAEKAAYLAVKPVTKCPPMRIATTFRQQLSRSA